jgi:hypothetical protein
MKNHPPLRLKYFNNNNIMRLGNLPRTVTVFNPLSGMPPELQRARTHTRTIAIPGILQSDDDGRSSFFVGHDVRVCSG